ncbi:Delta(6)-protoilludene synthase [Psilocybe cubensis]|uniref:Sesquiterpene synthase cubE n=2 Tax=Psilocybe cubensis TaxID=181762 RepID=CUBE_PSICU|nr:Delta(6)-protoilludene synthase [Psilocybe cubensis]KAH9477371.1 Delta(6)-protoilludene synthase [Psilocybe cubensis]
MSTANVATVASTEPKVPVAANPEEKQAAEPPFYMLPDTLRNWPYERIISPYYRAAQAESVAWLESFKPFSPAAQVAFNKCDFSLVSALTFPKATHYNLRSACDLMHTFFTLDEHTDPLNTEETKVHCEATMDAILNPDKPRPAGEPIIGEIARQFWKRASAYAPQATKERFVKAWRSYLDSVILQASRRDRSHYICTIDEYMVARRDNIGSDPSFTFLEMSLEVDIPHHIMEHPTIVRLNRDTTDMIVLANDMCSYKKEILVDDADYNAVTVVMHNNKVGVDEGIQWISDLHDEIVDNFLKLRQEVMTKTNFPSYGPEMDRQVEAYVEGLGQWIRGHDEWNFGSGRYFGDEGLEIQKTRKVIIA